MARFELGQPIPATHPSQETLNLLSQRRSTPVIGLGAPGPSTGQLEQLLEIAARVSDHRRVVPFRFIVFRDHARTKFGDVLAQVFAAANPEASREMIAIERGRFERAPLVIAVISTVDVDHRTPEWEQILTAGAVCQNMLVGANAMGFAGQWLTEWYAFDPAIRDALGLKGPYEQVAGFLYFGTAQTDPKERPRIEAREITTYWEA